jgi:hypothetical protein
MRKLLCLLLLTWHALHSPSSLPCVERKLESLLLMPEPKAMRSAYSITPPDAKQTVLTPYRESSCQPSSGIESYSAGVLHQTRPECRDLSPHAPKRPPTSD